MPDHLFFFIGLAFILMHEMDAVRCKEWRIFPGLSMLKDEIGYIVFMLAHLPLFGWLFLVLSNTNQHKNLISGLSVFFIIHMGLHLLFLKHPKNEFKDWISWTIIAGAAIFGFLELFIATNV
jgi:hypothetical protein